MDPEERQTQLSPMQLFRGVNRLVSVDITKIETLIYVVRGQRRNRERFPEDFMFQLSLKETENWISQIVISNPGLKMGQRKLPYAFTEQGVASLSAVLKSKRSIRVYLEIIRAFVSLRRGQGANKKLTSRVEKAETRLNRHEEDIATLFEDIEALSNPSHGETSDSRGNNA